MGNSILDSVLRAVAFGVGKIFPGGKKRVFREMEFFVNSIAIAMCHAVWSEVRDKSEQQKDIVAEMVNLLTGRPSPRFTEGVKRAALKLAKTTLAANREIRNAAVMCLRTLSVTRGTDNVEVGVSNGRTILWIAEFGPIPPERASWDNMHELALYMVNKYCPQTRECLALREMQRRSPRKAR